MTIVRVRWCERQRVSAADLSAEQVYRLNALGRHLLAPHDWGVVRGLRLEPLNAGLRSWRLSQGVAVDGYGREILVRDPIDFELPSRSTRDDFSVLLYYCESPSCCPPCTPCRDDPAPRTHQYVQLVVSETVQPLTADAADLSLARAAGRVDGLPAWPILVGVIGAADSRASQSETRYHTQRASIIRSPSGRVTLRQGPLGPCDQYQMLLSTDAGGQAPVKRLAVDRSGVAHVWKPLVISGAKGSARIALAGQASLLIEADMPVGVGRRVVLKGKLENVADPILTLDWQDDSGRRDRVLSRLLLGNKAFLDHSFRFLDMHSVSLKLVRATPLAKRMQVAQNVKVAVMDARDGAVKRETVPSLVFHTFEAELRRNGGQLALHTRKLPVPERDAVRCDPDRRVTVGPPIQSTAGGIAYFRAAEQATPAPTVRAIQAVSESTANGTPVTVLRHCGGEFDEGDHSARVAIGAQKKTPAGPFAWRPFLSLDGGGRVRLPEDGTTLHVSHSLQLPPITTNPADPLTQDLLGLAYNAGIRRAGKIQADIDITFVFPQTEPPTLAPDAYTVKRGETLSYKVTIRRPQQPATVKRAFELVVGKFKSGDRVENRDVTLRTIPGLVGDLPIISFDVTIPSFQHTADHVVIAVEVLASVGDKDRAWARVSAPIKVID